MTRLKAVFAFGAAGTTLPAYSIQENGFVAMAIIVVPANTNSVGATISIKDTDGYEVYNSGLLAAGTTTKIPSALAVAEVAGIPLDFNYTIACTLSGAAGATGCIAPVMLYVERDKP